MTRKTIIFTLICMMLSFSFVFADEVYDDSFEENSNIHTVVNQAQKIKEGQALMISKGKTLFTKSISPLSEDSTYKNTIAPVKYTKQIYHENIKNADVYKVKTNLTSTKAPVESSKQPVENVIKSETITNTQTQTNSSVTDNKFDSSASDDAIYVAALRAKNIKIPSIMYHKFTTNEKEVTDFVITEETLKQDFAEIKKRGYTPITVSEYYNMKKLAASSPSASNNKKIVEFFEKNPKPILITVDDGYKGIYTAMLPLMKEYNYRVNFYICGELIDKENPEYCTWEEIKLLHASGLAEIGNHTYSLHAKSKKELETLYRVDFQTALKDIKKNDAVIKEKTGIECAAFSFPYGQYDTLTVIQLKQAGIERLISTDYRMNRIADNQSTIGRFNRDASFTSKQFFDLVESK